MHILISSLVFVCCWTGGQTWGEYVVVPAMSAIPLPKHVSWDEGAACFVNPLTVISFIQVISVHYTTLIMILLVVLQSFSFAWRGPYIDR
jgi:hypothetical protein